MAKRGQEEFDGSDHRLKTSKLDFNIDNHDDHDLDDYDELNLEEESMQVDEELEEENKLLEHNAAEKESDDKALQEQSRDLEKSGLERSNEARQRSDTVAVVTSPCNPKDNGVNGLQEEELESAGSSGGGKKNHVNSEELNAGTTNGDKTRSEKKKPWGYQLELAGPGMEGQNSIICAPTGSGKTMTAALVCESLAKKIKAGEKDGRPFKAVFVVCLRNLVAQQCDALSEFLPDLNIGMLDDKQFLDDALKFYDVVVLTSQILVNALEQGSVQLKTLSLIIFDECHHTNLDHPYNKLMRLYHLEKIKGSNPLPQILGMTASLGVGSASDLGGAKGHYVKICANLDCMRLSHVRDPKNKAELEKFNPKPSEDQLKMMDKRSEKEEFYVVMANLMEEIELKYLKKGTMQVPRGTQKYESQVSTLKQEAEKTKETAEEMVACEALAKMNVAWMVHDELRTKDALQLLNKYFLENLESKPGAVEKALCRCYNEAKRNLERIERKETLEDWPLLKKLHDLLGQLFSENIVSHGIVMATTIQYVDGLMSFLNDYSPNVMIFPQKFVGHRTNIDNSMTESEQEHVLRQFRKNKINLLVSTDVTQEGLDIPQCNFVIRFNFVSNEIGAVQAKGRARAPDSKCFLIAYRGSVKVDREMKNIGKERWMREALEDVVSTSSEELQELIKKCQEDLYRKLSIEIIPMEVSATGDNGGSEYSIHCRRCKAFLCSTDHLVQYGCHYICVDEAFKQRIIVEPDPSPRDLRDDTVIGKSLCCVCRENIGSVLTYKHGSRSGGYNMGHKAIMFKARDRESYMPIKKWQNVPFRSIIRKENQPHA